MAAPQRAGEKGGVTVHLQAAGRWLCRIGRRVLRFFKGLAERWLILLSGALLMQGGEWLIEAAREAHSHLGERAGEFMTELGFAFLIAAVLFVLIEEWSARHHAKTAIGLLYGVRPQGWFFHKIEEYVLRQKFYRSHVRVTYAFKEQEGENILVHQSISYTAINRCAEDDTAKVPVTGRVDLKSLHVGPTKWDSRLGIRTLVVGKDSIPLEKLKRKKDPQERTQTWVYEEPANLPARGKLELAYNGTVAIEAMHHVVKHNHDAAVWSSAIPCDGVELCVTWEAPMRLKFMFNATHPEIGDIEPQRGERQLTVLLENVAFLKGHGIHFWWAPESELGEEQTPTAVATEKQA